MHMTMTWARGIRRRSIRKIGIRLRRDSLKCYRFMIEKCNWIASMNNRTCLHRQKSKGNLRRIELQYREQKLWQMMSRSIIRLQIVYQPTRSHTHLSSYRCLIQKQGSILLAMNTSNSVKIYILDITSWAIPKCSNPHKNSQIFRMIACF